MLMECLVFRCFDFRDAEFAFKCAFLTDGRLYDKVNFSLVSRSPMKDLIPPVKLSQSYKQIVLNKLSLVDPGLRFIKIIQQAVPESDIMKIDLRHFRKLIPDVP